MNVTIARVLAAGVLIAATGCGRMAPPRQELKAADAEKAAFGAQQLLDAISDAQGQQPVRLPTGVQAQQVDAAFAMLHAKLKIKEDNPAVLLADTTFAAGLNTHQKQGLQKVLDGYSTRVQDGSVKPLRGSDGHWTATPGNGQYEGRGSGHVGPPHATGNGWWSWSTNYSWWGVKVYLNHNFLYYLCSYSSWMLNSSGLPGWIKTVLGWIACGPHSFDGGYDGATVYITWAGVFWYSA